MFSAQRASKNGYKADTPAHLSARFGHHCKDLDESDVPKAGTQNMCPFFSVTNNNVTLKVEISLKHCVYQIHLTECICPTQSWSNESHIGINLCDNHIILLKVILGKLHSMLQLASSRMVKEHNVYIYLEISQFYQ